MLSRSVVVSLLFLQQLLLLLPDNVDCLMLLLPPPPLTTSQPTTSHHDTVLQLQLHPVVLPGSSSSSLTVIEKSNNDDDEQQQQPRHDDDDGFNFDIDIAIINATRVLESIGISKGPNFCHPTSKVYEPYVYHCDKYSTSTVVDISSSSTLSTSASASSSSSSRRLLEGEPNGANEAAEGEEEYEGPRDTMFYVTHGLCALACVIIAALAAGLTMGLLSLDPLLLLIKMRAGSTEEEKQQAAKLLPIVKQHHLLLVTLLLLNSMANEALPLFLEVLVSPLMAVILSVTFVLFFGEIIPSAIFTGPNKIKLASQMTPLVKTVMFLLYPIAYPIAKTLDIILHHDDSEHGGGSGSDEFNRGELSALVRIQYEERMATKQQRRKERMTAAGAHGALHQYENMNHVGGLDFSSSMSGRMSTRDSIRSVTNIESIRAFKREITHRQSTTLTPTLDVSRASSTISAAAASAVASIPDLKSPNVGITGITVSTSGISGTRPTSPTPSALTTTTAATRSESIHLDEVAMVEGALQMKMKMAFDVFTPLHRVYSIPLSMVLDEPNIVHIYSRGYSRIPVYNDIIDADTMNANTTTSSKDGLKQETTVNKTAVCGILMTRQLIVVNPTEARPISTLPLMKPMCVSPKLNLVDLLNLFQTGTTGHMALVCARPEVGRLALANGRPLPESAGLMGVITIEDVIEALLQEEIYDESDKIERERLRKAEWAAFKWKKFVRKKKRERFMQDQKHQDVSMGSVVTQAMQQQRLQQRHGGGGDEESGGVANTMTPLIAGRDSEKKKEKGGGFFGFFGFK